MAVVTASAFSNSVDDLSVTVTKPDGNTTTLTIKNLTNIPPVIFDRDCPIMYPAVPYQTDYSEERMSVGSAPFWQVTWTANYYFAYSALGAGRYMVEHIPNVSSNIQAISDAVAAACTALGVTEVFVQSVSDMTLVPGPDNKQFYGATIALSVRDYRNPT